MIFIGWNQYDKDTKKLATKRLIYHATNLTNAEVMNSIDYPEVDLTNCADSQPDTKDGMR